MALGLALREGVEVPWFELCCRQLSADVADALQCAGDELFESVERSIGPLVQGVKSDGTCIQSVQTVSFRLVRG